MPRSRDKEGKKVRYAVVGLGYIAQAAVLPAFEHAANSELAALVSDDPEKLKKLGRKYSVEHRRSYADYDALLASGEIDAVYIALPNSMHREYAVRAAQAGVHVLCEKPMAVTEGECRDMIRAAAQANVRLMVAYRLHFDAANLAAVNAVESGTIGEPRIFDSVFTMQVRDEGNIRLKRGMGGGTLYDIGIYCINAARYLFRSEPEEVAAFSGSSDDPRFSEVDEMTSAMLRFPGARLAGFSCSFGAADSGAYDLVGTEGRLRLDPAYEYAAQMTLTTAARGKTSRRTFAKRDQFGPELVYFSDCVRGERDPEPDGREGLADVRVIRALYESARTKKPMRLDAFEKDTRPEPDQEIRRKGIREPKFVHAEPPGGG
ncbi:MAG TPA: Gfo/Idh/MocA family oxidoreductase [Thermoanaerobaculia bacterium]|jgi:predicted dehydrogenase|nr:Gfo/Idh/MocA family oxidoreductase [Thermoanaerobaculia bacterium]